MDGGLVETTVARKKRTRRKDPDAPASEQEAEVFDDPVELLSRPEVQTDEPPSGDPLSNNADTTGGDPGAPNAGDPLHDPLSHPLKSFYPRAVASVLGRRSSEPTLEETLAESSGQPLSPTLAAALEADLGMTLEGVRIHTDEPAAEAAEAAEANALTVGSDIYFAEGAFDPGSPEGDRVLRHELEHVRQFSEGELSGDGISEPGDLAETEAVSASEDDAALTSIDGEGPSEASLDAIAREREDDLDAMLDSLDALFSPTVQSGLPSVSAAFFSAGGSGAAVMRDPQNGGQTGRPPAGNANDPETENGDAAEPTEAELKEMELEAKEEGEKKAKEQGENEGDDKGEEKDKEDGEKKDEEGGEKDEGDAKSGDGEGGGDVTAANGEDTNSLPSFGDLINGGELALWPDETNYTDSFNDTQTEPPPEVDRLQLVKDALVGGALEGAAEGVKSVVIDSIISAASTKIPYLSGFVEAAKIAYDPVAWATGVWEQGPKKLGEGFGKIFSGDPVQMLEGLLNVLEGAGSILGTLSSICWIVAAASFLLSFICPPALAFASLAASWATTFGAIGTLIMVIVSLMRLVMMGVYSGQILFGEGSPEDLQARADLLRGQTSAFTKEFTERAGARVRDNVGDRIAGRNNADSTATTPPDTRPKAVRFLDTAAGVVTGGGKNSRVSTNLAGARDGWNTSVAGTNAYRGRGDYAETPGGGPRSEQQRIMDMEHAGLTVHATEGMRQRFENRHEGKLGTGVNREAYNEAVTRRTEAADTARQRRDDLDEAITASNRARDDLEALEQNSDLQARIQQTEWVANQRQQAADAAKAYADSHDRALSALRTENRAMDPSDPNFATNQRILAEWKAESDMLHGRHRSLQDSADGYRDQAADLRRPIGEAADKVDSTSRTETSRRTTSEEADTALGTAQRGVDDALAGDTGGRRGGMTREQTAAAQQREAEYGGWRSFVDFGGNGTNDLMGHNKGVGATGFGGGLLGSVESGGPWEATLAWLRDDKEDPDQTTTPEPPPDVSSVEPSGKVKRTDDTGGTPEPTEQDPNGTGGKTAPGMPGPTDPTLPPVPGATPPTGAPTPMGPGPMMPGMGPQVPGMPGPMMPGMGPMMPGMGPMAPGMPAVGPVMPGTAPPGPTAPTTEPAPPSTTAPSTAPTGDTTGGPTGGPPAPAEPTIEAPGELSEPETPVDPEAKLKEKKAEVSAQLPEPPPVAEIAARIDGAVYAYGAADRQLRDFEYQESLADHTMAEGTKEIAALDGLDAVRQQNVDQIGVHQEDIQAKLGKQDELREKNAETQEQLDQSGEKGSEGMGFLQVILAPFLEMLSIIPGRVVGNSDGAAKDINSLNEGMQGQQKDNEELSTGNQTVKETSEEWTQNTNKADEDANADLSTLDATGQEMADHRSESETAMTELKGAKDDSVQGQADAVAEKERQRQRHAESVSLLESWILEHQATRESLMDSVGLEAEY